MFSITTQRLLDSLGVYWKGLEFLPSFLPLLPGLVCEEQYCAHCHQQDTFLKSKHLSS